MTAQDRIRRLRRVLLDVDAQLRECSLPCSVCGHEESMADTDMRITIRDGLRADNRASWKKKAPASSTPRGPAPAKEE